jgi:hypothetical protein
MMWWRRLTAWSAGARVIVPARDYDKAVTVLEGQGGSIEIEAMDPTSIDAFAQRYLISGQPLHLLVEQRRHPGAPPRTSPR